MKQFFLKMLSDGNQVSSFRFVFVLIGTLFPIAFVGVWTYSSILAKYPMDIAEGVRWLLGILLLSKSANLGVEAFKAKVTGDNGPAPDNGSTTGKVDTDAEKSQPH